RRALGGALVSPLLETTMPHGKICYLEIPAKTAQASADFYSSIFGWKVRKRGDGELAFDDPAGVSGTWVKESDRTPDERTRTYIMVDVIADTLKQIETAGGRVLTPRTLGARVRHCQISGWPVASAIWRVTTGSGLLRCQRSSPQWNSSNETLSC